LSLRGVERETIEQALALYNGVRASAPECGRGDCAACAGFDRALAGIGDRFRRVGDRVGRADRFATGLACVLRPPR